MQRVEHGKTNVGVVALVRLADALGVEPGVLLRRATLPEQLSEQHAGAHRTSVPTRVGQRQPSVRLQIDQHRLALRATPTSRRVTSMRTWRRDDRRWPMLRATQARRAGRGQSPGGSPYRASTRYPTEASGANARKSCRRRSARQGHQAARCVVRQCVRPWPDQAGTAQRNLAVRGSRQARPMSARPRRSSVHLQPRPAKCSRNRRPSWAKKFAAEGVVDPAATEYIPEHVDAPQCTRLQKPGH
ncbi:hypothetical protein WME75_25430 [Sorangium sp. So ce1014]|uniref:hypothetical protein n=1 Tax=Sorangium sp. So ce1014 TaxID=3133326 RepID=UPI003F63D753